MAEIKKEKFLESLSEPVTLKATEKIIDQMNNSICRIFNNKRNGTGFFVKIPYKNDILPVLITNNQVINKDDILNNITISIYLNNDKKIKNIKLDNNRKKYINEKYDITIIEIKENEDKLNSKYLELDDKIINYFKINKIEKLNYLNYIYSDESIYILNYLKDNDIIVSYCKLSYLNNNELYYQCNINENSSGSPILLTNNQKLIGIHNNITKKYKYNKGCLLIYLIIEFSKIKKNLLLINKEGDLLNNYIIAEFDIKENNQNIRIINSYEQVYREYNLIDYKKEYENEKEIKDNCEIRINDELIPFSYFYTFDGFGKYKIKYSFRKNITNINYMFYKCPSLANIDLSNFNSSNVINMSKMFDGCLSLTNINLFNFNTDIVTNMNGVFRGCSSLIKINLSNFKTNFVQNMSYMFFGCYSLKNIDLSNFNTNNVTDMSHMFNYCTSLSNLNLTNFNADNVIDMRDIFFGCIKLNKNNIIVNDQKILKQL